MSTPKSDATDATKTIARRRERDVRYHSLEQFEGEGAPRRFLLESNEMKIGRAENVTIRIGSKLASRLHATLTRRGTDFVVQDNDSHNGVFLNGVKIYSAILRDGDIIQIADCAFVYREG